jgi:ribosomal protein L32E
LTPRETWREGKGKDGKERKKWEREGKGKEGIGK